MKIGTVTEIKPQEYRVGMTPDCVKSFVMRGHQVLFQSGAGNNAGFEDGEYRAAGATVVGDAATVYAESEMIMKVKEPLPQEYEMLREDQILFTYLHLAASRELTDELMKRKVKGVAYETIETP
ncbi:MAG TPA: alanine dehydrogenase, partial [Spirochaetia bacterium]|nr:alanine dehydrogenase [Spirochaetia bacterium]